MDPDVLICGAGPTGLVLALWLARVGIRVRIVDAASEPGTTTRALVVHARTLEFYQQLGIVETFLREATPFEGVNLWVRRKPVAHAVLGVMGAGLSPFPYSTICAQDHHERFLVRQLEQCGVVVERSTRLVDFERQPQAVRVTLERGDGGIEESRAAFLAGCDGAHSRVRQVLGVGFPGGTYSQMFYVADIEGSGPALNGELHVALDESDFLGVFPLRGTGTARLIGIVRAPEDRPDRSTSEPADDRPGEPLQWSDVSGRAAERLGIHVSRVNWFSTYRVHHRVARRFQDGRVFLLGDAAHIHSPAGGQGMNTGIGDAVNLAWKLAEVIRGHAPWKLLDSYEIERIAFARRLVSTTDRAFMFATSSGRLARWVRTRVVPLLLPRLIRSATVRRLMFRTVSQTAIHYRISPLSQGRLGATRGGDRLPWYADNYASLDGRSWQLHVYGRVPDWVEDVCNSLQLSWRAFGWQPGMTKAGLTRDGIYLLRPDGHIALADPGRSPVALQRFARDWMTRDG